MTVCHKPWVCFSLHEIKIGFLHLVTECVDTGSPKSSFDANCTSQYIGIIAVTPGSGLCDKGRTCADTGGASDYVTLTCDGSHSCSFFIPEILRPDCGSGTSHFHMYITYMCVSQGNVFINDIVKME